ncbi:uncharacterized protein EDB93DRAFT_1337831 [Suillus bovinus]|uniref:uncharacterized protein n=1 Tax=Suillus bovinus TaxID=48563 RepID=UPI001B87EF87|nr:uncharacterized protein EDB93DRAFT_1337831 [Suillus bovinus]KAG2145445.1 hypothetical protein EDB93DRAFT_1337831 [Suillus bovinus]
MSSLTDIGTNHDWGEEFERNYNQWRIDLARRLRAGNTDDPPPRSPLLQAMGAAALEHARTFLQRSGSCLIQITLLWDDPTWIVPVLAEQVDMGGFSLPSREEIMAGIHLGLVIQELYAHVHRWREFTLRTTSTAHTSSAFVDVTPVHPSSPWTRKLHLQYIHNPNHAVHRIGEPSLFPGSAPPIRDLLFFGVSWAWPSSSMLSSNLVNLRIHYNAYINQFRNPRPGPEAKMLSQFLDALVNLRTLALEVDLGSFDTDTIKLPRLYTLAIKSCTITLWAVEFLQNVQMPNLRILTLCAATEETTYISLGDLLNKLIDLTDREGSEDLLELDELHLFNFVNGVDDEPLHRLYTQMPTVKTLTLGPGSYASNLNLAMGLLPTSYGLSDLQALPGLRTLVVFDIPKQFMRQLVLKRQLLADPLEELYCRYPEDHDADDWQHQVKKFHRIGSLKSNRYTDVLARRWSYLV